MGRVVAPAVLYRQRWWTWLSIGKDALIIQEVRIHGSFHMLQTETETIGPIQLKASITH